MRSISPVNAKILWLLTDQGSVKCKYREIGRKIGEKYPQTVKAHIEELKEQGKIIHQNDFIRLANPPKNSQFVILPIYSLKKHLK